VGLGSIRSRSAPSVPVDGSGGTITNGVSIKVSYKDGVFAPLEKVEGAKPDAVYTVFSDEELRDFHETIGWLKAAEKSFDFWNNPADAVYDTL
jgi:predicted DNA-binding antitoxin AbrB/MazE fold protein